jgi:hypothetical protein
MLYKSKSYSYKTLVSVVHALNIFLSKLYITIMLLSKVSIIVLSIPRNDLLNKLAYIMPCTIFNPN